MNTRALLIAVPALLLSGCNLNTDYPKVVATLSDKNYDLERQRDGLKSQLKDKDATITHLRESMGQNVSHVETLSPDRLATLFTVGRVELRKGIDADDFNSDSIQDGFRVLFRTFSRDGYVLPATGTVTIEAFDLAIESGENRVGKWTFAPGQLKKNWYDGFGLYHFAVNCPWDKPPAHATITFKLKFVDALTGDVFTDQQNVTVHLRAPATQPATHP